jgi:hypothetical protein
VAAVAVAVAIVTTRDTVTMPCFRTSRCRLLQWGCRLEHWSSDCSSNSNEAARCAAVYTNKRQKPMADPAPSARRAAARTGRPKHEIMGPAGANQQNLA